MSLSINYTPPPTGEKFMLDNAKMRVLMGPVGCIPCTDEFLTPDGWVRIDQYEPGMLVGVWDKVSQTVQFEPAEWVKLPTDEEFIRFDSGSLVMELSPEHTVLQQKLSGFDTLTAAAMEANPSSRVIPTTFELDRCDSPISDHEVRLRVMFAADGFIPKQGKKVEVTVRKLRKLERLQELLATVEHTFHVYTRRDGSKEYRFRFAWPYREPRKDLQFVWGLSTRQLRVVMDEMPHWDGLHDHDENRFHTTSKEEADAIQFAAHATGLRAVIRAEEYPANPHWRPLYRVYVRRAGSPKNTVSVRKDHTKITRVPTVDGHKYCFNTSTGFFVARCQDTIFITGNSGKSVTCCFEIIRRASMQEPNERGIRKTRCIVVRQTARQLQDTTIKTFMDWFPEGVYGEYKRTIKSYFFKLGDVECEIMFRALDDADDVANLNSLEATFAWVNESRDIDPAILDALSKRVGRFPSKKDGGPTWHGIFMDTNPPTMDTYHYYMMEHLNPEDGVSPYDNGWKVYKQPSGRSPYAENIENLPDGYYDPQGKSDDYIRVFIDGEYGLSSAGKPVYKYFRPDYHIAKQPLRYIQGSVRPLVIGIDCGLTPAAVVGQMDPRGRALVLAEAVSFDMGMQRFLRSVLKPLLFEKFSGAPVLVVVDPAGMQRAQTDERSVIDIIKAEGLKVIPARTNNISARINSVDDFLMRQVDAEPGFLMDPSCTRLKAAMLGGYRFKEKSEAIDKNDHSHVAEALQYLCLHLSSASSGATLGGARQILTVDNSGWT